jgi:tetrahydromethanopterin S-methyltransferase subunit G
MKDVERFLLFPDDEDSPAGLFVKAEDYEALKKELEEMAKKFDVPLDKKIAGLRSIYVPLEEHKALKKDFDELTKKYEELLEKKWGFDH